MTDREPMVSALSAGSPFRALGARLAAEWRVKLVTLPGFIAVFFAAYFLLLRFPVFPVTTIPLTSWDRWVSFQPWTLGLYLSLWFYVALEPATMRSRAELLAYYGWAGVLAFVALLAFLFWPTTTPVPVDIVWAEHPGFAFLKQVDSSQNACPSLHVAFAAFAGWRLQRILRELAAGVLAQAINLAWCSGIIYSTLATRQHVVVDVVAGALLGMVTAFLSLRVHPVAHR